MTSIPPINVNVNAEPNNSCNCRCPSACCITRKIKHDKDCHQHKTSVKADSVAKGTFKKH